MLTDSLLHIKQSWEKNPPSATFWSSWSDWNYTDDTCPTCVL